MSVRPPCDGDWQCDFKQQLASSTTVVMATNWFFVFKAIDKLIFLVSNQYCYQALSVIMICRMFFGVVVLFMESWLSEFAVLSILDY